MNAAKLWNVLCAKGPFSAVTSDQFASLLRELGKREIIFQDSTGLILLAPYGERITEHYSFYAAFASEKEYSIVNGNQTLGSMPISRPLSPDSYLIFAGRRWQVVSVAAEDKVVQVKPATGGTIPKFNDTMGADIHDRVREEIRNILRSTFPVPFLDPEGKELLEAARANYKHMELDRKWILQSGSEVQIVPWCGDVIKDTLTLMLQVRGKRTVFDGGLSISVKDSSVSSIREMLQDIAVGSAEDPIQLAATVPNKTIEKWDGMLPDDLLSASFASAKLDVEGVQNFLKLRLTSEP